MPTEIKGKAKINRKKKIARKKCKLRYASPLAILFIFYFVVIFVWVFNLFYYQLTVYRWILFVCLFVFLKDGCLDKIKYFIVIRGKGSSNVSQEFEFVLHFSRNTVRVKYHIAPAPRGPCKTRKQGDNIGTVHLSKVIETVMSF